MELKGSLLDVLFPRYLIAISPPAARRIWSGCTTFSLMQIDVASKIAAVSSLELRTDPFPGHPGTHGVWSPTVESYLQACNDAIAAALDSGDTPLASRIENVKYAFGSERSGGGLLIF